MGLSQQEAHQDVREDIRRHREAIARQAVEATWDLDSEMQAKFGPAGREKCHEDMLYHLDYLAESIGVESPLLYRDYLRWVAVLLQRYGLGIDDLRNSIDAILRAAPEYLKPQSVATLRAFTAGTIDQVVPNRETLEVPETMLETSGPHARLAREYLELLLKGSRRNASELILGMVSTGLSIHDLYLHVFGPVQQEIGLLWQTGRITVAQEHFCTAATQSIMSQLYPQLLSMSNSRGKIVALSVSGELHEIGIRMVSDLLEMEGWETYYLGANTPSHTICEVVLDQDADLLAISATMTYHLHRVREAIEIIRSDSRCADLPIIVGGYPFNVDPELWKRLGADGHASDVVGIGELADRLVAH